MAKLRIDRAPMGVSLQDAGRKGFLRLGISAAGPMDWARHHMANRMLAREPGDVAIEFGPAGLALTLEEGELQLSFSAPGFRMSLDGLIMSGPRRFVLTEGSTLEITPRPGAMWGYLGLRAMPDIPLLLNSYAENSVSGLHVARLREGSELTVTPRPVVEPVAQAFVDPYLRYQNQPVDILPSSQYEHFSEQVRAMLVSQAVTIAPRFDRMAYQLQGVRLRSERGHDILSDGVTVGAIQVPGDGRPFVLMADHQPTGGYPKIACVCKADLPRVAQMTPGRPFLLRWCSIERALVKWHEIRRQLDSLHCLTGS